MAEEIKVDGLAALQKTLKALPDRIGKKVVMQALRKAANVIKKDAQSRVPVLYQQTPYRNPGTVKKAIKVRKSKKDKYGVYVGIKPLSVKKIIAFTGKSSAHNPDDPYYWWQLEFGNVNMPAHPFLRPAFDANVQSSIKEFEDYAKTRVVTEAEKLAKESGMK